MEIKGTRELFQARSGNRTWLTIHARDVSHNGKTHSYFFASRSVDPQPPELKRPDAVIVVGILRNPGEEPRIVLNDEFRPAIGRREISFPAGLIDPSDYVDGSIHDGIVRAAHREFMEETGYDFQVEEVSPPNLYTSAGMTDESNAIVIGTGSGVPKPNREEMEDIRVLTVTHGELEKLLKNPNLSFSKVAWPFLWSYNKFGF